MNLTYWVAGLAIVVLLQPYLYFLVRGWGARRAELLDYFTEDVAVLFFQRFFPAIPTKGLQARKRFAEYHDRLFGRRHFLLPLVVLAASGGGALVWCADSLARSAGDPGRIWRPLPEIAVSAILGAYLWALYDMTSESIRRTLNPTHLLWATFRIVIAVPLASAVTSITVPALGVPVAFLLGAFPTQPLMLLVRRLATKRLGLGDEPEGRESEVQILDSVDRRTAERLADENITTIAQMSYCNPVEISIRTGLRLDVLADYVGQALVWNYLNDQAPKLRPMGLRGAPEFGDLWDELEDDDAGSASQRAVAEKTLAAAGAAVNVAPDVFRNTVAQIAEDPYTVFLRSIWAIDTEEDDEKLPRPPPPDEGSILKHVEDDEGSPPARQATSRART
jgi:hypothetical protein